MNSWSVGRFLSAANFSDHFNVVHGRNVCFPGLGGFSGRVLSCWPSVVVIFVYFWPCRPFFLLSYTTCFDRTVPPFLSSLLFYTDSLLTSLFIFFAY